MATIKVLDALSVQQDVQLPLAPGQATMALSRPVVIASDQSAVPASQSGAWNITNISGTVTLPTGAATAANQTALNALFPTSLGAKTAANSLAVTLATDGALVSAFGNITDAAAANGASGSGLAYLRAIKDAATDTTTVTPVKIDQTTPGTTDAVTVKTPADMVSFVPTLDTAAYASGDVLFSTTQITGVTRAADGRACLMSLTGIDKSKNKPAMTLLFYQTNVTSAAANAANNLSDSDQANLLGYVRILATDWIDYANNSIFCKTAINLLLEAASGTSSVYCVGILDAGTPTFAASDLVLKLGFVQS
jgi:hypothetical protein